MQDSNLEQEKEEKEKRNYWIYLFLFSILLFFCVFGITYSIYDSTNGSDNELGTGNIVFTYSDIGQIGNGIALKDAIPISDSLGKSMFGTNQYFDFSTTATTDKANLHYQLLIQKDDISTLEDKNVRIYLTQLIGNFEQELVLDDFSNLQQVNVNQKKYYVLYEKTLKEGLENYSDSFRLRMWVKDNAVDYENRYFSIKVDVYAYQVEED